MVVLKIFGSLHNLYQRDGLKNEMLFWPKLLFLNGISKSKCDLVFYVFLEETTVNLDRMVKSPSSI